MKEEFEPESVLEPYPRNEDKDRIAQLERELNDLLGLLIRRRSRIETLEEKLRKAKKKLRKAKKER